MARAVFPESLFIDGNKCRTPRLNTVLALLISLDEDSSGNKKRRIPENLQFSLLVEPGRASKARRTRASAASGFDEWNVRGTFHSNPTRYSGQQTTKAPQKSPHAKGAWATVWSRGESNPRPNKQQKSFLHA